MRTRYIRILSLTLGLICVSSFVSGQREDYRLTPQQENRVFFSSASAPMTKAINDITPSVVKHVDLLIKYLSFIEERLRSALSNARKLPPEQRGRLCKNRNPAFNGSIYRHFGLRGFPDPDRSCITDIQIDNDPLAANAPFSVDELFDAINARGNILNLHIKEIASRFIDVENNFTGAETPHRYEYNTNRAKCILHAACGVRVGTNWYISTQIHNRNKYENLLSFGRQVINEYARPVDGVLGGNLLFRLPEYRNDSLPREIREDTTTSIASWPRSAHPNCFRRVELPENPAIVDALDKADHYLQQAEDALTPSGVAILVLPFCLNLVPAALFAEVSTINMLLYILLSDILTCVPVLIKGVELLLIRKKRYRAFTVRMTSASCGDLAESAGSEVWAAECRAPELSGRVGLIFIILAIVFIIIGVISELLARRYVHQSRFRGMRRKRKGEFSDVVGAG